MRRRTIGIIAAFMLLTVAACGDDGAVSYDQPTGYPATTLAAAMEADRLPAGGTDNPNDEPYDLTFFENYGVNPRIDTIDDPYSTFALDVDTGSYTIARRWIGDGNLPDPDSVRVEEYVNYFDPGYAAPEDGTFAIHIDGGPTPFTENDRYQIVRIGLQARTVDEADRPPANLIFTIDVSGSMDREDRLETVKDALILLLDQLRPDDTVGIVIYGSTGQVLLEPTLVEERGRIADAIRRLRPGGSTNAEEGLLLAYDLATDAFAEGAINRIILASDGVANVGNTGPDSILDRVRAEANGGIQLVTVGFGMGNYNDMLMEQLADDGDGFYAYIDDLEEAERLFVYGLTGTLFTVAGDARVQVQFDGANVERWRLIGFENRAMADEDFRDDTVDAGEIGAGHHVTALYEIRLAAGAGDTAEIGTVSLRWIDPETGEAVEIEKSFRVDDLSLDFSEADPRFQLATVTATFAEVLRNSYWAQHLTLEDLVPYVLELEDAIEDADVNELADLVLAASRI